MAVTLSDEDYLRLLQAAEADDTVIWCDMCGSWLDHEDPRLLIADDACGCAFSMTRRDMDAHTCVKSIRPGRKAFE